MRNKKIAFTPLKIREEYYHEKTLATTISLVTLSFFSGNVQDILGK
jgi:hypothetical protein